MTITDRIASLLWDYTIAHNARPTRLRLTREDEQALDVELAPVTSVRATSSPRYMRMLIEVDAERTEGC